MTVQHPDTTAFYMTQIIGVQCQSCGQDVAVEDPVMGDKDDTRPARKLPWIYLSAGLTLLVLVLTCLLVRGIHV